MLRRSPKHTPETFAHASSAASDAPCMSSASARDTEASSIKRASDNRAENSSRVLEGAPIPSQQLDDASSTRGENKSYILVAVLYLLGLCMGALDMSIVNPGRTVMQNTLGIEDALGVWIITIYTLAYAVAIPVMGKLADLYGRKYIYLTCIALFGAGSLICGLSREVGSFELLLFGRVVQALGGGGIMPVATAEFGTAFPEEKRGMALGIVGMVYGVASIFGSSVGSLLLDIFGQTEWQAIFLVNIPICVFILLLGWKKLPNAKLDKVQPIDGLGILILAFMTLGVMYGLKNIDFFEFAESVSSMEVWPYLLASLVLLPLFILRERRAADPVINISYFRNRNIVITLVCAMLSGMIMMGTIFYPQFSENAMLMKSGSGGYFIALLGLGTAFGAMGSGKLIDRFGLKPVLAAGFIGAIIGSLFMAFVACENPTMFNVCLTMVLAGAGLGFTMGTPLNYMMLQNTDEAQSNSALATMSLMRSIATAVVPAIMVAFLMHAGLSMEDNLINALPKEVSASPLPYAAEIDKKMDDLRKDEDTKDMLEGIDIPTLSDYTTFEVDMNKSGSDFDVEISDDLIEEMKNSDVTNIVGVCKEMAQEVFSQVKPKLIAEATDGMQSGITAMEDKAAEMEDGLSEMSEGLKEMESGASELKKNIANMSKKIASAQSKAKKLDAQIKKMESGLESTGKAVAKMESGLKGMKSQFKDISAQMGSESPAAKALQEQIDALAKQKNKLETSRDKMKQGLAGLEKAKAGIEQGIQGMTQGKTKMESALKEMTAGRAELESSQAELSDAHDSLNETIEQLKAAKDAVPALFDEAEANYLVAIDADASQIQSTYQATLNDGFKNMAIFVAFIGLLGIVILVPYQEKRRSS